MYSIHSFHYKISPWVSQIQNRLKIHCRTEKKYIKLINKHLNNLYFVQIKTKAKIVSLEEMDTDKILFIHNRQIDLPYIIM